MKFDYLKKLKNFFILIVPEQSGAGTKSRKISAVKLSFLIILYTVIVSFFGFLFFSITPVGAMIFPASSRLSADEMNKINELNKRMIMLSQELENLKSTNERLRYAIMLGDSSLLDSTPVKKQKTTKKKEIEGNIFFIFKKLFLNYEVLQPRDYFFYKPADGFLSREFNPDKGHFGIDVVLKKGSPVYAAADGYVVFSDYTVKNGYMIIINHPDDYISVYKHCQVLLKKNREQAVRGELIALSGNSGEITTGPHLHFEIWSKGKPIDPKTVLFNY